MSVAARTILLAAVEPSGDMLGAGLAQALRNRLGPLTRFVGVGGPMMAAAGVSSAFDPAALAVVGAFNALGAYPEVLRRARQTASLAAGRPLDAAVLIDAWGFNLRVARALRRVDPNLPIIKYVGPQVWATRPGRARTLARTVDRLLTIHSFDTPYFETVGLPTTFVGNPVLNRDLSGASAEAFRASVDIGPDDPILLLLPGSRKGEVDRLMPVFRDTVDRLAQTRPTLRLVAPVADNVAERVSEHLQNWRIKPLVVRGEAARLSAMKAATLALACSGTVTTELALAGCPMVVVYRLDPMTYLLAKRLIRTPYISLLNVAAQRFVAPERVQDECAAERLEKDLAFLLDNEDVRAEQITAQTATLAVMRGGIEDPIAAAAAAVIATLRSPNGVRPGS